MKKKKRSIVYIHPLLSVLNFGLNPLPDPPILSSSDSAANKDMISKIWTNGDTKSDWVENIVGKGEIARNEQFLRFLQCFQKLSIVDASKWVSVE